MKKKKFIIKIKIKLKKNNSKMNKMNKWKKNQKELKYFLEKVH